MLTAWLTCSQCLFLWVLKIKEKSAGRRNLSPRPLCVSSSPETCPALLYGIWIGSRTVLTPQLISLCPSIPTPAVGTGERPQRSPDARGWASQRDFFALPRLPAHARQRWSLPHRFVWISHCLCEIRIFLPRGMRQEWNKLCLCSVEALAAPLWKDLYLLLRQLHVSWGDPLMLVWSKKLLRMACEILGLSSPNLRS